MTSGPLHSSSQTPFAPPNIVSAPGSLIVILPFQNVHFLGSLQSKNNKLHPAKSLGVPALTAVLPAAPEIQWLIAGKHSLFL